MTSSPLAGNQAGQLLNLPARQVVRRLGVLRLEEWGRARARLDDPHDTEALHDFRVALRRLRSLIRAFRPVCDDLVRHRMRRRLRRLADATGECRDLEVLRGWLLAQLPKLTPRQRPEARWMASRLEQREVAATSRLQRRLEKGYAPLHQRLWVAFASEDRSRDEGRATASLSAAAVVGRVLTEWTGNLEYRLGTIHAITDEAEAHAARILVKRLRYLLEPFQAELSGAAAAIDRLKRLQDLLGDLHDQHRAASELRTMFRDAAIQHADRAWHDHLPWGPPALEPATPGLPVATGGLAALARILRVEGEALFARLRSEWLDMASVGLCADLRALGGSVSGLRPPGIEIERKFLLSGLPPHAHTVPGEEIEQGWLPGRELVERLRHVRSVEGDAWYRTVKSGQGIQRIEIEEATTPELFEALWPLTEGCRVQKRRYPVPEGAALWQVDEFLDRDLVLAEIELPTVETAVELPAWLAENVVREVTAEPEYVNRALAR